MSRKWTKAETDNLKDLADPKNCTTEKQINWKKIAKELSARHNQNIKADECKNQFSIIHR